MTGLEINDFMVRKGWNQEKLAAELGTSQSTVSRWLQGKIPSTKYQEAIKRLFAAHGVVFEPPPSETKVRPATAGDAPLTPEAAGLLKDMVDRFLGAYHPMALRLWREAIEKAEPFPADIALSERDRDRLLKEAELQGHRARLRANRQTD